MRLAKKHLYGSVIAKDYKIVSERGFVQILYHMSQPMRSTLPQALSNMWGSSGRTLCPEYISIDAHLFS